MVDNVCSFELGPELGKGLSNCLSVERDMTYSVILLSVWNDMFQYMKVVP